MPYYFVVKVKDAFGNNIATSSEVSATPVGVITPPSGGSRGGVSSSIIKVGETAVVFNGWAYPGSIVTILKDGNIVATALAGSDASFWSRISNLSAGSYIFSVYSRDKASQISARVTIPVWVKAAATTNVGGVFIPPSVRVNKTGVKKGEIIVISGQSVPLADILITVNSGKDYYGKVRSNKDGFYLYNFDTSPLGYGNYNVKSRAVTSNQEVSAYSLAANFNISAKDVYITETEKCPQKGDLNGDCRVDFIDFSIALSWFKRSLLGTVVETEAKQLNDDRRINLIDFSILAYYWTG